MTSGRWAKKHPVRVLRLALLVLFALVIGSVLSGCSPEASGLGPTLVRYERVWPDGRVEQETIDTSGKILMKHGDVLERITLTPDDVATIEAALEAPIPTGSPEDSPKRTIELADGTIIDAPRLEAGTVTELLDNLMNTHTLS